jgi:hypothetical protein
MGLCLGKLLFRQANSINSANAPKATLKAANSPAQLIHTAMHHG